METRTNMKQLPKIKQIGPASVDRSVTQPLAFDIPFRTEVQTDEGPAILSLSLNAATELKKELETFLQQYGR